MLNIVLKNRKQSSTAVNSDVECKAEYKHGGPNVVLYIRLLSLESRI